MVSLWSFSIVKGMDSADEVVFPRLVALLGTILIDAELTQVELNAIEVRLFTLYKRAVLLKLLGGGFEYDVSDGFESSLEACCHPTIHLTWKFKIIKMQNG